MKKYKKLMTRKNGKTPSDERTISDIVKTSAIANGNQ